MSLFDEGMRAFNNKEYHNALSLFLQATKDDETNHKAWNALGVTLVKMGSYGEADACFKTAIELSPGNGAYIRNELANREKIPATRSHFKIIRSEISYVNHIIHTKKTGSLILTSLILCIIFILLYLISNLVIIAVQPSITRFFAAGSIGAGICFILLIYGNKFIKSISSFSGVAFVIVLIGGMLIVSYLILNPSLMPLGNTNNTTVPEPSPPYNLTSPNSFQFPNISLNSSPASQPVLQTVDCKKPVPSLNYTINDYDPFTITVQDIPNGSSPIRNRTWSFGDGTTNSLSSLTHAYAGQPTRYLINYSVTNDCGTTNTSIILDPKCSQITPDFSILPVTDQSKGVIYFIDKSTPIAEIASWRWIFGDGESYYTTNASERNSTHHYSGRETYSVSLMVENRCGQVFTHVADVSTGKTILVFGNIWNDKNADGVQDKTEPGLPNWTVTLDEYTQDTWTTRQIAYTNQTGEYIFPVSTAGGPYRVREIAPDPTWRVTNPSSSYQVNASPMFIAAGDRIIQYTFGNVQQRTDKVHQISIHSSRNGTIEGGGYQSWVESGETGTITINNIQNTLSDAERCMITILTNTSEGKILVNGSNHEYTGINASVRIHNSTIPTTDTISAYLPTYVDYGSNLHMILNPEKSSYTSLIVDGTVIPVNWRQKVDIYDLMPSLGPNMILKISKNETVFIGQASDYSVN